MIPVRALESALLMIKIFVAHECLSADGSCVLAEPDIHLRSKTPQSPRRRLSLCSLPVPKQMVDSLGSCLRRPADQLRDLAACASSDPDLSFLSFLFGKVFRLLRSA